MADVLIYADTDRSPELRHEVPISIGDPFLYGEHDGARHVLIHPVEAARMHHLPLELHAFEEYGADELLASGRPREEIRLEVLLRAVRGWGIESAATPWAFPLRLADHLRANGVELRPDQELFVERRRSKNELELAGIRRAQAAAHAGMEAARALLRRGEPANGRVLVDGEPLTCERIKAAIEPELARHGSAMTFDIIASHGPQTAIGHHAGEGEIAPGEPIVVDLGPRDRESGCYADMTRTFVVGDPPEELVEWHALCRRALDDALAGIRAGVQDSDVYRATAELFRSRGFPTLLDKELGVPLEDGFYHSLGHGVGLDVHEPPTLGLVATHRLVAGEVLAIEPGLYRRGFGGVRLEDLVLVTEDGCENLTDHPYDLEP
ncbi:MAG: Xaa-Pro peptidase family protein [Actinomycetota bacterium]|nr:Xaa-Pro peptidase family protein [Actinomycetota bacterium]